jgi:lysozyme
VISASALVGIAMNEGYVGTAYKDVVGVPTIGFGETKGVPDGANHNPAKSIKTITF